MPRQIIDTESSRPAYVARNITMILVALIIALALLYFYERQIHPNTGTGSSGSATTKSGRSPNRSILPPGK